MGRDTIHPSRLRRWLMVTLAGYLGIGFLSSLGTLVCYNVRNWELMGGFSVPLLYLIGLPSIVLLWPVYLHANFVNGLGLLGRCSPL